MGVRVLGLRVEGFKFRVSGATELRGFGGGGGWVVFALFAVFVFDLLSILARSYPLGGFVWG